MTSVPTGTANSLSNSQIDEKRDAAGERLITVYIMGKAYEVPAEATIMEIGRAHV